MSFIPLPQEEKWGDKAVITTDKETTDLLKEILNELKKITIQLSLLTEQEITQEDLE
jgi:hypothetical protein